MATNDNDLTSVLCCLSLTFARLDIWRRRHFLQLSLVAKICQHSGSKVAEKNNNKAATEKDQTMQIGQKWWSEPPTRDSCKSKCENSQIMRLKKSSYAIMHVGKFFPDVHVAYCSQLQAARTFFVGWWRLVKLKWNSDKQSKINSNKQISLQLPLPRLPQTPA